MCKRQSAILANWYALVVYCKGDVASLCSESGLRESSGTAFASEVRVARGPENIFDMVAVRQLN